MQISSGWEAVSGKKCPGQTEAAEGVCSLLGISLETGWMKSEPRKAESLRTPLALGQATSEKTKLPSQEMSPT